MAEIREGDRVTLREPWVRNHREQFVKMFKQESGLPDGLRGTVRTITSHTVPVRDTRTRRSLRAPAKTRTTTTVLIDWDATPEREAWSARYALSAVKRLPKAKAPKETWKMTPVRDLAEGDVIETPHNEAAESITFIRQEGGRDWFTFGITGNQDRSVPGGTEVLKLFREEA